MEKISVIKDECRRILAKYMGNGGQDKRKDKLSLLSENMKDTNDKRSGNKHHKA